MRYVKRAHPRPLVEKPEGGYCLIPLRRLYAVWWCYRRGDLEFRDVRTYFALEEMLARRCRLTPGRTACYTLRELGKLTDARCARGTRASLRRLERAGLSTWNATSIEFHEETLDRPGFAEDLTRIANHRRRIPVPRRTLRWLARATRPILVATVLGHLFRCVYSKGRSVACEGSISATWIAGTFNVDHRNVKRAKAQLRALKWLSDRPSQHWHRQRYGGRALVNLTWRDETRPQRGECGGAELPPRLPPSRTGLPPPDSHKELPKEARNQKRDGGTGVEEQAGTLRKPRLARVVSEDLREPARTAELFRQAARHGLVKDCPMDRLQFFAAAERAKRLAHNPGGFFAAVLQRRLWRNIAACDEESARRELAKIPEFFHGSTACPDTCPWTSAVRERESTGDETEDPASIRELVRRSLAGAALADRDGDLRADSPLPPRVGGIAPAEQNGVKEGTRVLAGRRP